jgi:hypothetical protein
MEANEKGTLLVSAANGAVAWRVVNRVLAGK